MTEKRADIIPRLWPAECAKRDNLKQPILVVTRQSVIANVFDHVLRNAVGCSENIAKLVLPQDRVASPWPCVATQTAFENLLALGRKVPI